MGRYFKASIPKELADGLRRIVEAHPELGYRSTNDAVKEAVREFVERLERRLALGEAGQGKDADRVRQDFAQEVILAAERYLGRTRPGRRRRGRDEKPG